MISALKTLASAAVLAPSGDNTQPWRFLLNEADGSLSVVVDSARDPSPMNSGGRMARIAVGTAVENIIQTAAANDWPCEVVPSDAADRVTIRIGDPSGRQGRIEPALANRVTNRRLYRHRPLPPGAAETLQADCPPLADVATHWMVDPHQLEKMARVIGRADAVMFSEPAMRAAFLSQVRFDAAPRERVGEGLSLASLELSPSDRLALGMLRRIPPWLFAAAGLRRTFQKKARRLVTSASGICLIAAGDRSRRTDLSVGRALERAWLAMTRLGLAAQPMMSLCVLDNVLEHGSPERIESLGRRRIESVVCDLRDVAPQIGEDRPAAIIRFGFAAAPSGRTGRRRPVTAATSAAEHSVSS